MLPIFTPVTKGKRPCSYLRPETPPVTWIPLLVISSNPLFLQFSPYLLYQRSAEFFSVKGQRVSILGFVGLKIFVIVFQWNFGERRAWYWIMVMKAIRALHAGSGRFSCIPEVQSIRESCNTSPQPQWMEMCGVWGTGLGALHNILQSFQDEIIHSFWWNLLGRQAVFLPVFTSSPLPSIWILQLCL